MVLYKVYKTERKVRVTCSWSEYKRKEDNMEGESKSVPSWTKQMIVKNSVKFFYITTSFVYELPTIFGWNLLLNSPLGALG